MFEIQPEHTQPYDLCYIVEAYLQTPGLPPVYLPYLPYRAEDGIVPAIEKAGALWADLGMASTIEVWEVFATETTGHKRVTFHQEEE